MSSIQKLRPRFGLLAFHTAQPNKPASIQWRPARANESGLGILLNQLIVGNGSPHSITYQPSLAQTLQKPAFLERIRQAVSVLRDGPEKTQILEILQACEAGELWFNPDNPHQGLFLNAIG